MYQELIRSEGMIEHLVRGLKKDNRELQMHCAAAIFKVSVVSSLNVCFLIHRNCSFNS